MFNMKLGFVLACVLFPPAHATAQSASTFEGKIVNWHGFTSVEFTVNEKPVTVVLPDKPARTEHHPWVWHGEFFGHRPQPDIELLKRGFHIVYTHVPDGLGCPEAVAGDMHLWRRTGL